MRLLRALTALALLHTGTAFLNLADGLLGDIEARRAGHVPARHSAGLLLLSSIVGIAICAVWIAVTWRAWG